MSRNPSYTVADGLAWLTGRIDDKHKGKLGFSTWGDASVSIGPFSMGRIDREYGSQEIRSYTGGVTVYGAETPVKQKGTVSLGAAAKIYFALATGNNALNVPEFHIVAEASAELKFAEVFSKVRAFTADKAPALLRVGEGALDSGLVFLNNVFDVGFEFKGVLGISVGFSQADDGMHHGWVRLSTMLQADFKLFGTSDAIQTAMDSYEVGRGVDIPTLSAGGGRAWQIRMVDVGRLRLN
ncbi:MAG: hypothetical protein AAGF11_22920 [Myxococcota bacterium]